MENAEEILHFLEEFSKRKPRTIPQELNDYLAYVARTGDPVYQWSLVKSLFKEKLLNVITDFYETTPGIDIPSYPNVDPFNYDTMKNSLIERLDSFTAAPFTVQRICELLTYPRKQYNRIDKFMRAVEKNILVVSTREPGIQRHNIEPENGEPTEPIVNGSDNSDYHVDVEMEDMSWKENPTQQNICPQPSSSESHITVDDAETPMQNTKDTPVTSLEKTVNEYESLTPPEPNNDPLVEPKIVEEKSPELLTSDITSTSIESDKIETSTTVENPLTEEVKKVEVVHPNIIIPEIKIDDSEMTERKLSEKSLLAMTTTDKSEPEEATAMEEDTKSGESKETIESIQPSSIIDENSVDSNTKEESDHKHFSEISTSSEESSSSSENIDGNSNSPNTDTESSNSDSQKSVENTKHIDDEKETISTTANTQEEDSPSPQITMQSDNYSISDVNSVLPQLSEKLKSEETTDEKETERPMETVPPIDNENINEEKTESVDMSIDNKET